MELSTVVTYLSVLLPDIHVHECQVENWQSGGHKHECPAFKLIRKWETWNWGKFQEYLDML